MPLKNNFTRKEKIAVLKSARHRIKTKRSNFICHALPMTPIGEYLKRYIMRELQGRGEFSNWLCDFRFDLYDKLRWSGTSHQFSEKMRKLRLQWLDWMIKNAT